MGGWEVAWAVAVAVVIAVVVVVVVGWDGGGCGRCLCGEGHGWRRMGVGRMLGEPKLKRECEGES